MDNLATKQLKITLNWRPDLPWFKSRKWYPARWYIYRGVGEIGISMGKIFIRIEARTIQ